MRERKYGVSAPRKGISPSINMSSIEASIMALASSNVQIKGSAICNTLEFISEKRVTLPERKKQRTIMSRKVNTTRRLPRHLLKS